MHICDYDACSTDSSVLSISPRCHTTTFPVPQLKDTAPISCLGTRHGQSRRLSCMPVILARVAIWEAMVGGLESSGLSWLSLPSNCSCRLGRRRHSRYSRVPREHNRSKQGHLPFQRLRHKAKALPSFKLENAVTVEHAATSLESSGSHNVLHLRI